MTRLIKVSKNQKPTRDSFIGTLGSPIGEASQISLNSFTSVGASSSKLGAAQAELQACEAHLAVKEKELDELRVSAVRRGLEVRCKAMVECGWNWGEMGKEGLRALEGIENVAMNGLDGQWCSPVLQLSEFGGPRGLRWTPPVHPDCGSKRDFVVAPDRARCACPYTRVLRTSLRRHLTPFFISFQPSFVVIMFSPLVGFLILVCPHSFFAQAPPRSRPPTRL